MDKFKRRPVLHEAHQAYANLITGITGKRVEAMEKTITLDALVEWQKFDDKLLIHGEPDTGNLEVEWDIVWTTTEDNSDDNNKEKIKNKKEIIFVM